MGCGFAVIVPQAQADAATTLLAAQHPGSARIGTVTAQAGRVRLPALGIEGDRDGLRSV